METIVIPVFQNRVSPRLDYTEHLHLFSVENGKVLKKESIKIITRNRLERINRVIRIKPDIIICNGLTERCYVELTKAKITVIPWIKGTVDEVLQNYFAGYIRESGTHTFCNKNNFKIDRNKYVAK